MNRMARIVVFVLMPFLLAPLFAEPAACQEADCIAPPADLVSWLPGDDSPTDVVGNNDASLSGGITFGDGINGAAFVMDGIDGYADLGNDPSLHFSQGDFTVMGWVRFDALSHPPGGNTPGVPAGDMSILDKASPDNSQGWRLLKQDDNRFWFCFGFCQWNSPGTAISQTYVTAGQWYHVALTKSDSEFVLYVDGVTERVRGTPSPINDDHGAHLKIGRNSHDGAHMNGAVDEVQIYHRALAAEEVAAIAAAGAAGVCKAVPEPDDEVLVSAYVNARVNCRNKRGLLPVTILGSDALDVGDLDVSTMRFGPTGTEAAEAHGRGHYRDVDSDGDLDLVVHFARGDADLGCDDTEALLTGETEDGASFSTAVLLNVVGGRRR